MLQKKVNITTAFYFAPLQRTDEIIYTVFTFKDLDTTVFSPTKRIQSATIDKKIVKYVYRDDDVNLDGTALKGVGLPFPSRFSMTECSGETNICNKTNGAVPDILNVAANFYKNIISALLSFVSIIILNFTIFLLLKIMPCDLCKSLA